MQRKKKSLLRQLFRESPFLSDRLLIIDVLILLVLKAISPIFLYIVKKNESNADIHQNDLILISERRHNRERPILSFFGNKICRSIDLSESTEYFEIFQPRPSKLKKDWLSLWFYISANPQTRFIITSISDVTLFPLYLHPSRDRIIFDSFDIIGDIPKIPSINHYLSNIFYKFGKNYIARDGRLKAWLHRSKNYNANVVYIPDLSHIKPIEQSEIFNKFKATQRFVFVSSGWTTASDDDGILKSLKLIQSIWPDSEVHLCLTQFMTINSPHIRPLLDLINSMENWHIHNNLNAQDYNSLLKRAHFGIMLHDKCVFKSAYDNLNPAYVKRCSSARVSDYAAAGCILLSCSEFKFINCQFKKNSAHGEILYLKPNTPPAEAKQLFDKITSKIVQQ
jgi:hypothetical protein